MFPRHARDERFGDLPLEDAADSVEALRWTRSPTPRRAIGSDAEMALAARLESKLNEVAAVFFRSQGRET